MSASELPAVEEYDIIFAGGGTTAGVVAGRLAAADPFLRILIIEMGPHTEDDPTHLQVGRFLTHQLPGAKTVRNVIGNPSEHLNGRQLVVQHGQCVGGGSSINFAMYTRPPALDYDEWSNLYDNPGWSFNDLLPLIRKAETYQSAPNQPTHGDNGPLKVSYGGFRTNIAEDYMKTVTEYEKTRVVVDDANRMTGDVNHIAYWPKWIDRDTGCRSDVAHHYVYNTQKVAKNFHLHVGCSVRRIVIEDERATGVEYVHNPQLRPDADNISRIAHAKRLVVVSAGAFGSPAILERSGVGAKEVLERSNVKPVVDLPGVGENYKDHPLLFVPFNAREDAETLDGVTRGDPVEVEKWSSQWLKDRKGLMATNGLDAGMRYRPSVEELRAMGPDVVDRWNSFYADSPEKAMLWLGVIAMFVGPTVPPANHKCYSILGYLMYPAGVGSVHINSADHINSPLDFVTGVLSCKEDLAAMRYSYKLNREHGRRMSSYVGEYAPDHPKFPEGSAAAIPQGPAKPVSGDAPSIVYTEEDDNAIDDLLRAKVLTAWHPMGTCAMKPRSQGGVVDPRLNVYGIKGLKFMVIYQPDNLGPGLSQNTQSVAVAIGEKAAMLIAEELGMNGV